MENGLRDIMRNAMASHSLALIYPFTVIYLRFFCTPVIRWFEVDPKTLCQFTGLCDKNGKEIWENDILMCHVNSEDLVKVAFGEFGVRNIETGSIVDKVVGWHYEIIPTDAISGCEPFCWSMPLTEDYIDRCEMEVVGSIFDNLELLQEES